MSQRKAPTSPRPADKGKANQSSRGGFVEGHESVDAARRPGPGETRRTAERPGAPRDPEGQNSGRRMNEELFVPATEDDAGALPHQLKSNVGPIREGANPPPPPDREPKSLPEKTPTL